MAEAAWKSLPLPEVNSRWDSNSRTVRVMAVAEGYVLCRFTGNIPFAVHLSDWYERFSPKIMPKRQRRGIELPRITPAVPPTKRLGDTNG